MPGSGGRKAAAIKKAVAGCLFSVLSEGGQAGDFEVRFSDDGLGRPRAGARGRTIDPDGGDTQSLRGNHVMIDALADVQPFPGADSDAFLRHAENRAARFVAA